MATKFPDSLRYLLTRGRSAFSPHFTVPGCGPHNAHTTSALALAAGSVPSMAVAFYLPQIPAAGSQERARSLSSLGRHQEVSHNAPHRALLGSGLEKLMVLQVTGGLSIASARNTGLDPKISTALQKFRPLE